MLSFTNEMFCAIVFSCSIDNAVKTENAWDIKLVIQHVWKEKELVSGQRKSGRLGK